MAHVCACMCPCKPENYHILITVLYYIEKLVYDFDNDMIPILYDMIMNDHDNHILYLLYTCSV